MWLLLSSSLAAAATPVVGLDWTPLSRGDLVWSGSEQLSGELVGEFDGLIRPAATAYAGVQGAQNAVFGGLGYAQITSVEWTGDGYRKTSAGGVRPSVDYQRHLTERAVGAANPWIGGGLYGVIPFASDRSDAYTPDEQDEADLAAEDTRGRIGGIGGRAGFGGEYRLSEGLTVGARYHWTLFYTRSGTADSYAASILGYGEAALRVQFEF